MAKKERRNLSGKVVAITGGARGIGKATAEALVRKGCRVAIGDLDAALAEETAASLGGGTVALSLDVTHRDSFRAFLDAAERELGPIDVLINNAGIMPVTPFAEELVASIRAVDERPEVLHEPDPLPSTRFPADRRRVDQSGRDTEAERRCQRLPGCAEVLVGIPDDSPAARAAVPPSHPNSRWVNGTAAGTGDRVKAAGLTAEELERVAIVCASGMPVVRRADYCLPGPHAHDREDLR